LSKYEAIRRKISGEYKNEKFEQVAGVAFTIDNARVRLKKTAGYALNLFYEENDAADEMAERQKEKFHKILNSLPQDDLSRVDILIKTAIEAKLRLDYGELAVDWLYNKI